jgi:hypothetical protein
MLSFYACSRQVKVPSITPFLPEVHTPQLCIRIPTASLLFQQASVVQPFAHQDLWGVLLYAGRAGGGLFGSGDLEDVAFLSARRQGGEGLFQGGVRVEFSLQLVGDLEVGGFSEGDSCAGFFEVDGLLDVRLDGGLEACNLGDRLEAKLTRSLHVFADAGEQIPGVLQESAFEKHEGNVFVEALNERDVLFFMHVTGLAPLDFLGEAAALQDFLQGLRLLRVLVARVLHGRVTGFACDLGRGLCWHEGLGRMASKSRVSGRELYAIRVQRTRDT